MIPLFKVYMAPGVEKPVGEVLNSGFIGQGAKVEEFEKLLKERFNTDYVVTTNSATSADHLALELLKKPNGHWPGFEPGDEALVTPLTCTASNFPAIFAGLNLKWVDVDPLTLNMDLDDLARKITKKTKVILLVHWGGYPVDLDRVKEIQLQAQEICGFKPAVIEDCAHAMGSTYKGQPVGTVGNLAFYSFQAIKHFTTGDGGCLITPHSDLYRQAKLLRWYGIDREGSKKDFRCEEDIFAVGTKWHMNDINATIGIHNFPFIDEVVEKHKYNAAYYDTMLKLPHGLRRESGFDSAFWIYSVLVDDKPSFMKLMKEKGISVSQVHERNDRHTCVRQFKSALPSLDKVIKQLVHLPVGWWVTEENLEYITEVFNSGW